MKRTQSGNALFMILIAIFLLGGLTVLLSRTGSQTEDTGDTEQLSIQSSNMLKYAAALKTTVDSLKTRGCGENQISFWNTDTNASGGENAGDDYYNASAPVDKSCHVFLPQGGGLTYKQSEELIKGGLWGTSGTLAAPKYNNFACSNSIEGVGVSDGTAKSTELYWAFELPYNIDRAAVCKALNKGMGYTDPTPPLSAAVAVVAASKFAGLFVTAPGGHVSAPAALVGKKGYCYNLSTDTQRYIFYYVLMAR